MRRAAAAREKRLRTSGTYPHALHPGHGPQGTQRAQRSHRFERLNFSRAGQGCHKVNQGHLQIRGRKSYTSRNEERQRGGAAATLRHADAGHHGHYRERESAGQPRHILLKADTKGQEQGSAEKRRQLQKRCCICSRQQRPRDKNSDSSEEETDGGRGTG